MTTLLLLIILLVIPLLILASVIALADRHKTRVRLPELERGEEDDLAEDCR